jgi:alpha-beta hydrolase superfamily lysophospholipase
VQARIESLSAHGASTWLARQTPLVDACKAAGLDVTLKAYSGGWREMLNETSRAEVVSDLLAWLDRAVARLNGRRPTSS